MKPSLETDDPDLEQFRSYLYVLARAHLRSQLQCRLDASDLVQQTLMDAYIKRRQFRGTGDQRAAWLRQILSRNLADALRRQYRAKRDLSRELSLEADIDGSFRRADVWLHATQSSPSQNVAKQEELLRLADALATLPDDQREAVVGRHLQGMSLAEVARHLDRSEAAAAGLVYRGLNRLHDILDEPE